MQSNIPYQLYLQLSQLSMYDNQTQLNLLFQELDYIPISPPLEWFQQRFRVIDAYSELQWSDLAQKYEFRDYYLCQTAQVIFALCAQLVDEWHTKPHFNLKTYSELIKEVYEIWNYYRDNYDESEEEMDDLINMMSSKCSMDESV